VDVSQTDVLQALQRIGSSCGREELRREMISRGVNKHTADKSITIAVRTGKIDSDHKTPATYRMPSWPRWNRRPDMLKYLIL
jgi:hypothetical protein